MRRRELLLIATVMMAAPGGLRGQQKAMPVIGLLSSEGSDALAPRLAAFRKGLSQTGWVEGTKRSSRIPVGERWL
jgi:putative ABC transport system substrate-binding protein